MLTRGQLLELDDLYEELLVCSSFLAQSLGQFVLSFHAQKMTTDASHDTYSLCSDRILFTRRTIPRCGRAPSSLFRILLNESRGTIGRVFLEAPDMPVVVGLQRRVTGQKNVNS